ncbi:MAG: glycosyl hydrolase 108 family protein [candidate division Zixibacteria bacterium]|nr:glycosyl hydrolase 108 family protein [candidate division Zixibacteria bacterium]
MASFGIAYQKTLEFEGGYVFDPDDGGGETYRGIARRFNPGWDGWKTIDRARGTADFPQNLDSIEPLQAAARKFYKQHYWDRFQGDMIVSQEIADELFDTGVNLGVTRAVTFLQAALNILNRNQTLYQDIADDGSCGPETLEAIGRYLQNDPVEYLLKIANILQGMHYIAFMKKNPMQEKYARGWLARVAIGPTPQA